MNPGFGALLELPAGTGMFHITLSSVAALCPRAVTYSAECAIASFTAFSTLQFKQLSDLWLLTLTAQLQSMNHLQIQLEELQGLHCQLFIKYPPCVLSISDYLIWLQNPDSNLPQSSWLQTFALSLLHSSGSPHFSCDL